MAQYFSVCLAGLTDTLPASTSARGVNATFLARPDPDPAVKNTGENKDKKKKAGTEKEKQMQNNQRKLGF